MQHKKEPIYGKLNIYIFTRYLTWNPKMCGNEDIRSINCRVKKMSHLIQDKVGNFYNIYGEDL
jgi:hypothetical protein